MARFIALNLPPPTLDWRWYWNTEKVVLKKAHSVRKTGVHQPVYCVTYEWSKNKKLYQDSLKATVHHPFLLKSGEYRVVADLSIGDRLQPFHVTDRTKENLYRGLLRNRIIRQGGRYVDEHRFVHEQVTGADITGYHIHHKDHNHINNSPENLEKVSAHDHCRHHFGDDYQRYITAISLKKMAKSRSSNKVDPIYWDKAWLQREVGRGKSGRQIAKELNVTPQAVLKYMKKYGIQSKQRRAIVKSEQIDFSKQFLQCAYSRSLSLKHLAKDLGVGYQKCRILFKRHQIAVRSPREQKLWEYKLKELDASDNHRVVSIEFCGYEDVYDMTVEDTHNFVANGVFVHNSPHPQIAFIDEIDLMPWQILQQAFSMPQSKHGIPSKTVLTSTRKFPNGSMQRMLDEADEREDKVYKWCIWEVVEALPKHDPVMMQRIKDVFGGTLPKNIDKANGYYTWRDTIKKYLKLDSQTWESEWLCLKPGTEGLIYSGAFTDEHSIILDWDVRKQKLGQFYLFEDFGHGEGHPDVALFCWLSPIYDHLVVFDELYMTKMGTEQIWQAIVDKLATYGLTVADVYWVPDYHGLTEIADRKYRGALMMEKLEDSKLYDVPNGIAMVRKLFEARLLQITPNCINLRNELLSYSKKKNLDGTFSKDAVKKNDHGPDALRYGVIQLFRLMMQYLVDKMEGEESVSDDSDSERRPITSGIYVTRY